MATVDFPPNDDIAKQGKVGVRYFADNSSSLFLSAAKKEEKKERYVELAKSSGRYFLLVYKIKKNSTVPYFKIELLPSSVVKSNDRYSEFRFYIDNEDTAIFDLDDSTRRNEWLAAINKAIAVLNGRNPSPLRLNSRPTSPERKPSFDRSKSPPYAKSSITFDTSVGANDSTAKPIDQPIMSSQPPPRSRLTVSANTAAAAGSDSHIGSYEPVRRIQKHLDSTPLGVGRTTPERERAPHTDLNNTLALGSSVKGNLFGNTTVLASPFPTTSELGGSVSPIAGTISRNDRAHFTPTPMQRSGRPVSSPDTGVGIGPGTGNPGPAASVIGGDSLSPPRAPAMRLAGHASTSPAQETRTAHVPVSEAAHVHSDEVVAGSAAVDQEDEAEEKGGAEMPLDASMEGSTHHSAAMLHQEVLALSAMNDELNEALERTESMLHASEEDHLYQINHLQVMLEKAQAEPLRLKAELNELQEEHEALAQTAEDQKHTLELNATEIGELRDELAASQKIILGLQDTITEYEVKYSERNVERISQLESALNATHSLLAERDSEVEELSNQLEAFRSMIREKENELRANPLDAKSAELTAKRVQMQREIDELRDQLDRSDVDFATGFGGAMESQIKAKMVPLNMSTKKLTMDLVAAHAAEEAQRVSKVRLESLVHQQEGYIEQLTLQVATLKNELVHAAELAQELAVYKDDARSAALQREMAQKERDELARRVGSLEREVASQRDAYLVQLEAAQAEIFKQKAHVSKVGIEDSHLHTEIAILNRRIELGKEQFIQLEAQLHEAQRQLAMEGQHSAKKKESFEGTLDAANQTVRELQSQCKSLEDLLAAEQIDSKRKQLEQEEAVAALKRANKEVLARSGALEEKVHKLELGLTSERINATHLRELNEGLEAKLQSATDKYTECNAELEASTNRSQKLIAELRQQLKESEAQRRALSERDGTTHRELSATLKAAEDKNRALREDLAEIAAERQNEARATADRLAAQLALQEKIERKNQELERLLSSSESEKRIAEQHHATREAELVTTITELTTEKDALEVFNHREKGEVMKMQRALEDVQNDLRSKTVFHEKLTKLHNEQVQVATGLSEEIQQLKRAAAEAQLKHGVEVDQLNLRIRSLLAAQDESTQALQARNQSLEDSLIATSHELKRTTQQLDEARAQLAETRESQAALKASLSEQQVQVQALTDKLSAQASELAAATQQVTELTEAGSTLRDTLAEQSAELHRCQTSEAALKKELESTKAQLRGAEEQLRETLGKLESAEDQIHYLQDIAIPDLNNSAVDTVERSKSDQNRLLAEIEALHRSIEQREKAAKELHARIRQLEEAEMAANQSSASLSLKLGEMLPIKEHNARLEAQRQTTANEIAELAASKHAALAERDEAFNRVTAVVQDCRREAYALRRVASNIAIHADAEVSKRELPRTASSASGLIAGKGVTDVFGSAEEIGAELREMVGLVSSYTDSMLRDFVALRTSSVHQWFTLQSEMLKSPQSGAEGAAGAAAMANPGSPQRAPQSPSHRLGSPYQFGTGDVAHTIPTASLSDLLQQTESMLTKLISREKTAVAKLTRQVEEETARKNQAEAKIADLQTRFQALDEQLLSAQSSKHSSDQRSTAELNALQQRIAQLNADLNKRQDEYSEMIAGLTKSHEEQSSRQAAHLASVMEQRISEANLKAKSRVEEVEQRLRASESALHGELDELKRDYNRQVEQCQRLERDFAQRDSEVASTLARFDAVQAELEDKTYQLENTLSQLEKAELKAAKEARQRLELERTLRRFKNPGSNTGATPGSMGSFVDDNRDAASEVGSMRQRPSFAVGAGTKLASRTPSVAGPAMGLASSSVRERANLETSFDNVSSHSASFVQEFDEARDLPSPAARPAQATPQQRSFQRAAATPDSAMQMSAREYAQRGQHPTPSGGASIAGSMHSAASVRMNDSWTASRPYAAPLKGEPAVPEANARSYLPSASSTIRSTYSSPDMSPEPASLASSSARNLNRSQEGGPPSNSAFARAFQATSRIEEAMKAKGWKLNK